MDIGENAVRNNSRRAPLRGWAVHVGIFLQSPIDSRELVLVNFAMSNKIRSGEDAVEIRRLLK